MPEHMNAAELAADIHRALGLIQVDRPDVEQALRDYYDLGAPLADALGWALIVRDGLTEEGRQALLDLNYAAVRALEIMADPESVKMAPEDVVSLARFRADTDDGEGVDR